MIIKRMDTNGILLPGDRWIGCNNPEFPEGDLYTEEEFGLEIRRRLRKQKAVPLEDLQKLQNKLDVITKFVNSLNKI